MSGTTPHDNVGPRESTAPRDSTAPRKSAKIVVVSDRIAGGERENTIGQAAAAMLREVGFTVTDLIVVPEGAEPIRRELEQGIADGVALLLTCGGTDLGPRNLTPEETLKVISTRLETVETQVLVEGLKNTPKASMSRGVIGLSSREPGGTLVVNASSSSGGMRDCLKVILAVWPSISGWIR